MADAKPEFGATWLARKNYKGVWGRAPGQGRSPRGQGRSPREAERLLHYQTVRSRPFSFCPEICLFFTKETFHRTFGGHGVLDPPTRKGRMIGEGTRPEMQEIEAECRDETHFPPATKFGDR